MSGMSPLIVALAVTLAAFVVSHWWFGVLRRRKAETSAGIRALAGMKWRECAGLVLQALGEKGYVEAPSSRQPGDGGTEFLLSKGDDRVLLGYKHGTAYRLGEANVRDFANAVQLQGANNGILVTLGTAEGFARDLARRYGVDLIDGRSLWPQVEPFAPSTLVEDIRLQAANEIRRGQRMGVFASIGLGLVVFLVGSLLTGGEPDRFDLAGKPAAAPAAAAAPAPAAPTPELSPQDAASQAASAEMKELEAIARLTDQERAQRRLTAAARVADLEEANSAIWSTLSTLNISLVNENGIDTGLVNEACAILIEYEELRFTRLQLDPPPSSNVPVRWRQCQ